MSKRKRSEKNNGPRRNVRGFRWCVISCFNHFKLVPCYFWSIISPYVKFDPNRTKNTEVGNFYFWSILVGWAGRSKNGHMHFKLVLSCFRSIFNPHAKFHPNRTKNTGVRKNHFWSILVGQAGRSKNGYKYLKHSTEIWRVSPLWSFWLVGWLDWSAWLKLALEFWFKADSHE